MQSSAAGTTPEVDTRFIGHEVDISCSNWGLHELCRYNFFKTCRYFSLEMSNADIPVQQAPVQQQESLRQELPAEAHRDDTVL
jgi:hypothetical protein